MKYSRRDYLAIAGIDAQLFKTLLRRNQVPAIENQTASETKSPEMGSGATTTQDIAYTAHNAIMLAFSNNLVVSNSFTRDSAKKFIQTWPMLTNEAVRKVEAGEEAWISAITYDHRSRRAVRNDTGEVTGFLPASGHVGLINELIERATEEAMRHNRVILAIGLLNTKPIIRRALDIAKNLGLGDTLLVKE